jgi:hypothetical protein
MVSHGMRIQSLNETWHHRIPITLKTDEDGGTKVQERKRDLYELRSLTIRTIEAAKLGR